MIMNVYESLGLPQMGRWVCGSLTCLLKGANFGHSCSSASSGEKNEIISKTSCAKYYERIVIYGGEHALAGELDLMIPWGPFQPLELCDSVMMKSTMTQLQRITFFLNINYSNSYLEDTRKTRKLVRWRDILWNQAPRNSGWCVFHSDWFNLWIWVLRFCFVCFVYVCVFGFFCLFWRDCAYLLAST